MKRTIFVSLFALVVVLAAAAAIAGGAAEEPKAELESQAVEPAAVEPPAPIESELLRGLIPPVEFLGDACDLKPIESAVGATPIPVASNPMMTGDRRVVGFVSVFVMPPSPEEEASWEADVEGEDPGDFLARVEQLMEQRIANVRAALVAIYESAPGGAETGIFALEFIEPLSEERQKALAVEGPGGAVLTSAHVAAAVWTDATQRECFDVVLEHVRTSLAK